MMNKNVLLEDIKIRRKSKEEELASLSVEFKKLESRKENLEKLLRDYDELIFSLENGNEEVKQSADIAADRLNLDEDILQVFNDLNDGVDPLGKVEGLFMEDVQKHLQAKGISGSLNTVAARIIRLEQEGKLKQLNAPQKRYRRYARVNVTPDSNA